MSPYGLTHARGPGSARDRRETSAPPRPLRVPRSGTVEQVRNCRVAALCQPPPQSWAVPCLDHSAARSGRSPPPRAGALTFRGAAVTPLPARPSSRKQLQPPGQARPGPLFSSGPHLLYGGRRDLALAPLSRGRESHRHVWPLPGASAPAARSRALRTQQRREAAAIREEHGVRGGAGTQREGPFPSRRGRVKEDQLLLPLSR